MSNDSGATPLSPVRCHHGTVIHAQRGKIQKTDEQEMLAKIGPSILQGSENRDGDGEDAWDDDGDSSLISDDNSSANHHCEGGYEDESDDETQLSNHYFSDFDDEDQELSRAEGNDTGRSQMPGAWPEGLYSVKSTIIVHVDEVQAPYAGVKDGEGGDGYVGEAFADWAAENQSPAEGR